VPPVIQGDVKSVALEDLKDPEEEASEESPVARVVEVDAPIPGPILIGRCVLVTLWPEGELLQDLGIEVLLDFRVGFRIVDDLAGDIVDNDLGSGNLPSPPENIVALLWTLSSIFVFEQLHFQPGCGTIPLGNLNFPEAGLPRGGFL
jgi:hypothetical protein